VSWARLADNTALIRRHATTAKSLPALARLRVTPLRSIALLCRRTIKRIDQMHRSSDSARVPVPKPIERKRFSAPTRTPDSDEQRKSETQREPSTRIVQSDDEQRATV